MTPFFIGGFMKETEIKKILKEQFGEFKYKTDKLTKYVNENEVDFKGYIKWLIENQGLQYIKQKVLNETNIKQYKLAVANEKTSLPQLIVNAGELYNKLSESSLIQDPVIDRLESMTQLHVLYFMFISIGQNVDKYRSAARRYCQIYPQVVIDLPEPYCLLGKAFIT